MEASAARKVLHRSEENVVSSMTILLLVVFMLVLAVLSPWLGTDTTSARSERAQPPNGWFPAAPQRR